MSFDNLKKLLQDNQSERLAKEQKERSDKPRHTVYKGNRTIQQLGDQPIENSVVLNNQSLAIGDVMLPLAKGNVLRRVDNTNGGALLGSAYRDALENDFDANGRRRSGAGDGLGRNGGIERLIVHAAALVDSLLHLDVLRPLHRVFGQMILSRHQAIKVTVAL